VITATSKARSKLFKAAREMWRHGPDGEEHYVPEDLHDAVDALIAAARRDGARDMRERAASTCDSAAAASTKSERKQCAWGLASQIRLLTIEGDVSEEENAQ
jgi:uncharacterized membrane protein YebE (DUF533 family)